MKEPGPSDGFTHLRWTFSEGIGYLYLDHPPSNEMNQAFLEEFERIIPVIRRESSLRGIICSGNGRHFSSGANLDELLSANRDIHFDEMHKHYRSLSFIEEINIPVVAAIRGVCIGAAFELALLCHFRICTEDSVMGLPETTFNLMPGLGGVRKMAELAGKAKTLELVLRGATFGAQDAMALGLTDLIVPKKALMETAVSLIEFVSPDYDRLRRALYVNRYIDKYVAIHSPTV